MPWCWPMNTGPSERPSHNSRQETRCARTEGRRRVGRGGSGADPLHASGCRPHGTGARTRTTACRSRDRRQNSMNTPLTDGELLDLLADALDPAPIRPTPAEYEQLREALATLPPPEAERRQTPRKVTSLRRLPHPVAAVVMVATLTTGGAAAAVGTNTLPDPLRSLAFAVGLPVTSPAGEKVDNDLAALRAALNLGDAIAIRADAAALSRDLDGLSPDDRVTFDGGANLLLAQAAVWLSTHPSVSDPIGSGERHQGTDDRVDGAGGRAVTKRGSEGGPRDGRGDDGAGTREQSFEHVQHVATRRVEATTPRAGLQVLCPDPAAPGGTDARAAVGTRRRARRRRPAEFRYG